MSDADCFSIRKKTKKECLAVRNFYANTPKAKAGEPTTTSIKDCGQYNRWGAVRKVCVTYEDTFDLLITLTSEWGIGSIEKEQKNDN